MFAKILAAAVVLFSVSSASAEISSQVNLYAPIEDYSAAVYTTPEPTSDMGCHVEYGEPVGCEISEISEACQMSDDGLFYSCALVDYRGGTKKVLAPYGGSYVCPFTADVDFFACWREGYRKMADIQRLLEDGRDSARLDAIIQMDLMKADAERFLEKRFDGEAEDKRMTFFREYFVLKDKVNGTQTYSDIGELKRSFGLLK